MRRSEFFTLDTEEPQYFLAKGGRTIGYQVDEIKNGVNYSTAKVHPNDRYSKSIGRAVVNSKIEKGETKFISCEDLIATEIGDTKRHMKFKFESFRPDAAIHALISDLEKYESTMTIKDLNHGVIISTLIDIETINDKTGQ